MKHYVIINDYRDDYEGEVLILGVVHSWEEATEIFQRELIEERKRAEDLGYDVNEDTEVCFTAEWEEEWSGNYTKLYIQKV